MANVLPLPLLSEEATAPPDAGLVLDAYLLHHRAFRDAMRDARRAQEGHTQESWYASSLGSCFRQQYMQRRGIPRLRPIDADAFRTFAWGDHVEDFLRRMYQRCGLVESTQVRLEHGSLVARGDLLLRYPAQQIQDIPEDVRSQWSPEWVGFLDRLRQELAATVTFEGLVHSEIKSAKSSAMKYMYKRGPRENHLIQVGCSIALTDLVEGAPEPDFFQIEYIGKDAVGVLRFPVTDKWGDVALARWRYLDDAWAADADPREVECECTKEKWRVTYCAYFDPDAGSCCANPGLTAASHEGDPY